MNTTAVIVMGVNHLTQVHLQTMQLLGAYRDRLPADACLRATMMNACAAIGNARLARATDDDEWAERGRAKHYRALRMTELVSIVEDSSVALAGLVLGPRE